MKHIAIIGAGYTGLTTAYRLQTLGYKVTVLERGAEIGGLVAGCKIKKTPIERAYHFIYKTDFALLSLAQELEIRDKIKFYNSTSSVFYNGKLYPFMTAKDLLMFPHLSFISKIRMGVSALYLSRLKKWHKLTSVTACDWIKKWMGVQAYNVIWQPLLEGKFNLYYNNVVMSWLWARIKIRTDSQDSTGAETLGYITGGFRQLSDSLGDKIIANGGTIRLNEKIDKVRTANDTSVEVHINDKIEKFDALLFTVPTNVYANLINGDKNVKCSDITKLKSVNYLDAVVMLFASKQKITPYFWHNVNDKNIPFIAFLSPSALTGVEVFDGHNIYYIGAYVPREHKYMQSEPSKIINEWKDGLEKMFPNFDRSKITQEHLFKFTNAQHIVDLNYKDNIPDYIGKIPNTFLANFSQIYPVDRGVNYAIDEGNKMANLIDRSFSGTFK